MVKSSSDPANISKKSSLSAEQPKSDSSTVISSTPDTANKSITPRSQGISPMSPVIMVGMRVFARWSMSDGHYYPGRVLRGDRSNTRLIMM